MKGIPFAGFAFREFSRHPPPPWPLGASSLALLRRLLRFRARLWSTSFEEFEPWSGLGASVWFGFGALVWTLVSGLEHLLELGLGGSNRLGLLGSPFPGFNFGLRSLSPLRLSGTRAGFKGAFPLFV